MPLVVAAVAAVVVVVVVLSSASRHIASRATSEENEGSGTDMEIRNSQTPS